MEFNTLLPHKYKATISYLILPTHPNKECVVGGWDKDKVYTFTDTYTFEPCSMYYGKEEELEYMKHDLSLVAGGGYTTDNIEVKGFEFEALS